MTEVRGNFSEIPNSSLVDQIAEVHAAHALRYDEYAIDDDEMFVCDCGVAFPWEAPTPDGALTPTELVDRAHAAHVAHHIAEVVGPRIDTAEQLDALPAGSVVSIGRGCGLYEKDQAGDWGWPDNDYPFREAEHSGEDVILLYSPGGTE